MVIATTNKYIKYLSPSCYGKAHDYGFFKQLFNPKVNWFERFHVLNVKKNDELSEKQKNENKTIAQERILVENSICGLKRYRILTNKLRTHTIDLYDNILGVCAGLWNFYLSN